MKIRADFHVHSKFSRATSGDLDLMHIHSAAQLKGLHVVGTGDFCHPAWFAEIESKFESAEPGLLQLKPEESRACDADVPARCRGPVRFVLTTEISNIYKKDGRTRKNHNLVFAPDLESARRLNRRLEKIGNIRSDGRPILGLDARDLLEIVLETSPEAFLIPAHVWTPWFSMLGAKSGFDSLQECFRDLSEHVFAIETGLSSDPAMNWRVSALDGLTLVSNSDAHSPGNLAREANCFDTELSYFALKNGLRTREGFEGTLEFFPEHGKYHLDGHRDCGVRLDPRETRAGNGCCPACGKPLTIGVLYRVEELADRADGFRPKGGKDYRRLVPLTDVLAEVLQCGPKTGRVGTAYRAALATLGPELTILQETETEEIERLGIPLLAEAIRRVRVGELEILPGYDGEYGKVSIFRAEERSRLLGQRMLFAGIPEFSCDAPLALSSADRPIATPATPIECAGEPGASAAPAGLTGDLNPEQQRALGESAARMLIVAGPGTGKTHTLTRRIHHLIEQRGVRAENILALTFTNRAAAEMRTRLIALLGDGHPLPTVATIHGFCLRLLREDDGADFRIADEEEQDTLLAEAIAAATSDGAPAGVRPAALRMWIMRAKQDLVSPDDVLPASDPGGYTAVFRAYQKALLNQRLLDYEDLIREVVARLESDPCYARACHERFSHVMVDEYQDLNFGQYRLIRNLVPSDCAGSHLCVIGDPDQSIYGFRGSDRRFFECFPRDYPDACVLRLTRNYRSTETILTASFQIIERDGAHRERTYSGIDGIPTVGIMELRDEHAEAEAIARRIESLVGGTGYHAIDTGRADRSQAESALSYCDFAVLTRTLDQIRVLEEHFLSAGVPFQSVSRRKVSRVPGIEELLAVLRIVSQQGNFSDVERVLRVLAPGLAKKGAAAFRAWSSSAQRSVAEGLAAATRFPIPGLGRERQLRLVECVRRIDAWREETAGLDAVSLLLRISGDPALAALLSGDEQRNALEALLSLAGEPGTKADPGAFLDRAALLSDTDLYHPRAEKVALLSMHAAKGLEFAVVFVAGCEDGFVPHRTAEDREEERRLLYVAMTRARRRLFLTRACRRRIFGRSEDRGPSPFVAAIEARRLQDESPGGGPVRRAPDQLQLF